MEYEITLEDVNNIKSHMTTWSSLSSEEFKWERLAGLSNLIWKVSALSPKVEPQSLIYRKFGVSSCIVDREKEDYILKELYQSGVGPTLYGGNKDFRVERFYESITLTSKDLEEKAIRKQLAKRLAELHSVQISHLDKTPAFKKLLDRKSMIRKAEQKAKREIYTSEERRTLDVLLSLTSSEEIAFLKKVLPTQASSVVFCHNDVHAFNILSLNEENKLILIDFEYADYNYRAYDIVNLFNEGSIVYDTPDFPFYSLDESKFPEHEELYDFVKYYVFFKKFPMDDEQANLIIEDDDKLLRHIQLECSLEEFAEEVEEIMQETYACRLFSHYNWILWSIIMSKSGNGTLEHLHYAHRRYEVYQNVKSRYFSHVTASGSRQDL